MRNWRLAPCAALSLALAPPPYLALCTLSAPYLMPPSLSWSLTLQVKYEGRMLYLTCVCMSCLDGTSSSRVISCR